MAKVPFSKLKTKINTDAVPVQIGTETIAVKQYLPIQEKLALIGRVVEFSHDENHNFSNPVKTDVITNLQIIFNYTDIVFTEKQKEDLPKLYDLLYSSGIIDAVIDAIPDDEYQIIVYGVQDTIDAVYKYQNSVLGLLDTIKEDYSGVNVDLDKFIANLKNSGQDLSFLKEILTEFN